MAEIKNTNTDVGQSETLAISLYTCNLEIFFLIRFDLSGTSLRDKFGAH